MSSPEFHGFGPKALPFFKALGFHQNREWFHENKDLYESDIKIPMGDLVEHISTRLSEENIPLHGSRKTSLFRVNRDVRFAKEKHPYNTHASAVLTRTGTKKDIGGAYMHFTPNNCFFAAGIWEPSGLEMKALREQIISRKDQFLTIEKDLKNKGLAFETESMLKRPAAGFKEIEDENLMQLLRHKSFIVNKPLADAEITSPKIANTLIALCRDAMPLLNFCWGAMDPIRQAEEDKKS